MRVRRFVPGVALVVAGLAVLAIGGGRVATDAVAMALIGIGGVVAVAMAFFAIGESEDRDRRAGRS